MYYALITLSFTLLSTFVCATPLEVRQANCHPNFQGVGTSVVWDQSPYGLREWVPGAVGANITTAIDDYNQAAEFRFEETGSYPSTYVGKQLGVPANNVVITAGTNNKYVGLGYLSSSDPNQTWDISCDACGTNALSVHGMFASGCTIKSVNLGLCVQVDTVVTRAHSAPSFLLQLATCSGTPTQKFQFWLV